MSNFSASWSCPSNIALVKYWGKYGAQMPSNASLSFTLSECRTESTLEVLPLTGIDPLVEVFLKGERRPDFDAKVEQMLKVLREDMPWIGEHRFVLRTGNTFPHSSGIASSASGMGALALCLCELHERIEGDPFTDFYRRASRYARLGSGSACRSIYGGVAVWGKHPAWEGSSQEYAVPVSEGVHEVFKSFRDTILLVHRGSKDVSSTIGHKLMNEHPFADRRFELAGSHMTLLKDILKSGDLDAFIGLVEREALMLHGLIMSSDPGFILMKPNTLSILEQIRSFRQDTGLPVLFTLDAGANVHLLYPDSIHGRVSPWIDDCLAPFCENKMYICDHIGKGPYRLTP